MNMLIDDLVGAFIFPASTYNEKYKNDLVSLMLCDPTSIVNEKGKLCGEYAIWIGHLFLRSRISIKDKSLLKMALDTYNKNKENLPSIKEFNDLFQLMIAVKDLPGGTTLHDYLSKCDKDTEIVYEDDEWLVVIPHTFDACRKIGYDTHWDCAMATRSCDFERHHKGGKFYININKSNGDKSLFDFNSDQFFNSKGYDFKFAKEANFSKKIKAFYKAIDPYFLLRLNYDMMIGTDNGFFIVRLNYKENYMNPNGMLISPDQWFDTVRFFNDDSDNYGKVTLNHKENYINAEGELLSPNLWFDCIFKYGLAMWLGMIYNSKVDASKKWYIIKEGEEPIQLESYADR